ncbi:MAG: peptidylprolyl isomerase [Candidatus Eisenbacteria bacterium]|nr:peptidylprolyl isomerase [Candidatus Eisenbacteria bacterium]
MKKPIRITLLAALALAVAMPAAALAGEGAQTQPAAGAKSAPATAKLKAKVKGTIPVKPAQPPSHIQVQHILIGFKGSVPGKPITRTLEEAKKLAYDILQRARDGEDYDKLVAKYTDDQAPGVYGMSNNGVAPAQGEYPRNGMVPAFGNVGFELSVGNIGIADYDKANSPFGFHIVKRVK